jgi:hypothetical protein
VVNCIDFRAGFDVLCLCKTEVLLNYSLLGDNRSSSFWRGFSVFWIGAQRLGL